MLRASDPRTAWGWIAVSLLFPVAGPVLYLLFGINRVRTRGRQLGLSRLDADAALADVRASGNGASLLPIHGELVRTGDVLTGLPLLGGNHVEALHDGDQAYPRMIAAIDRAQRSVALATYLFETDATGRSFIEALARAQQRGVQVRVLIDGVGDWYSLPSASRLLRRRGLRVARFHPPRLLPPALYLNLRTHRKLLLVDGEWAYTGGMNIGGRHVSASPAQPPRVTDMHFELRGPVLAQLAQAFAQDWQFAAGEHWVPDRGSAPAAEAGRSIARVVSDGPNEDLDHLNLLMQSAIASAHRSVRIMTPYFLPPRELEAALLGAALRGLRVDVVLPGTNNLRVVHYAARHMLGGLLAHGVNVWYQPGPFCHSKLFVIDGAYTLIGSANLDPRSLRLNFELGVELYDAAFARSLDEHFEAVIARSLPVTRESLARRSLPRRLRDAACWLFSPYL